MGIDLVSNNFQTWAMLGIIVYLVKILVRVDRSMVAMEVKVKEQGRRIDRAEESIDNIRDN